MVEKTMVDASTSQLINEIYNRPALWDRTSPHYHIRLSTDNQWDEISQVTGVSKERAKIRWKRLRDIYRKELKKIIVLEERDGRSPDQPRWAHFASMDFLRNSLVGDLKSSSAVEPTVKKEPSVSDGTDDESKQQQDDPYSDHIRHHRENSLWSHQNLMEPTVEIQTDGNGGRVSHEVNGEHLHNMCDRHRQETVVNMRKRSIPNFRGEDDDDMHFLKSLAPYLKMLPPLKKLKVRNDIQMAILAVLSEDVEA